MNSAHGEGTVVKRTMEISPNLIATFDFLKRTGFFEDQSTLEWARKLNHLYDRGWLYSSMHGEKLLAVAGAFRIPAWDKRFVEELPEKQEGNILFISFFSSESEDSKIPLKLLKQFLRENPTIQEIVYYRKKWKVVKRSFKLVRKPLAERLATSPAPKRLFLAPPELVPVV